MTTNTNVKHFPFSQFFKLSIGHCLGSAHHEYLWCLLYNKNLCLHQICNEILISTCSYDPCWLHQTSFYDPRGYVLLLNSSKQIFVLFTSWLPEFVMCQNEAPWLSKRFVIHHIKLYSKTLCWSNFSFRKFSEFYLRNVDTHVYKLKKCEDRRCS